MESIECRECICVVYLSSPQGCFFLCFLSSLFLALFGMKVKVSEKRNEAQHYSDSGYERVEFE